MGVDAAKTGMLGSADVVEAVAVTVAQLGVSPLVVDPVLASGTGDPLLDDEGLDALRQLLLPLATVVTPNLAEASALVGGRVDDRRSMEAAAAALVELGAGAALVTGGHLGGDVSAPDCLLVAGEDVRWLEGERVGQGHAHGGGCVLSAAVCAGFARGLPVADACRAAKGFVGRAIAAGVSLGFGKGAVDPEAASGP
jgi:hydroxymethylpyrimidine/phosphomethylpyrimidine kinase